jgi:hypothetical protein
MIVMTVEEIESGEKKEQGALEDEEERNRGNEDGDAAWQREKERERTGAEVEVVCEGGTQTKASARAEKHLVPDEADRERVGEEEGRKTGRIGKKERRRRRKMQKAYGSRRTRRDAPNRRGMGWDRSRKRGTTATRMGKAWEAEEECERGANEGEGWGEEEGEIPEGGKEQERV